MRKSSESQKQVLGYMLPSQYPEWDSGRKLKPIPFLLLSRAGVGGMLGLGGVKE